MCRFLLLLLFILGVDCFVLQNKTKLYVNNRSISGPIEIVSKNKSAIFSPYWQFQWIKKLTTQRIKIVFTSDAPIELILYTTTGIPLHFKGKKISYTGHPTYYQINSINDNIFKVSFDIYEIDTDWIKIFTASMTIITFFILIFYKRDHIISQLCLMILLSIEIFKSTDYDKIADRIFHKILF